MKTLHWFHILLQLLGTSSPDPPPGLCPWTPLGTSGVLPFPRHPARPFTTWTPSIVKSWVRLQRQCNVGNSLRRRWCSVQFRRKWRCRTFESRSREAAKRSCCVASPPTRTPSTTGRRTVNASPVPLATASRRTTRTRTPSHSGHFNLDRRLTSNRRSSSRMACVFSPIPRCNDEQQNLWRIERPPSRWSATTMTFDWPLVDGQGHGHLRHQLGRRCWRLSEDKVPLRVYCWLLTSGFPEVMWLNHAVITGIFRLDLRLTSNGRPRWTWWVRPRRSLNSSHIDRPFPGSRQSVVGSGFDWPLIDLWPRS